MKNVAIIGHGPSLTKQARGEEINKYDTIVRLGDFFWCDSASFGSRTDYAMMPLHNMNHIQKLWKGQELRRRQGKDETKFVSPTPLKETWIIGNGGDFNMAIDERQAEELVERYRQYINPVVFNGVIFKWLNKACRFNIKFRKFSKSLLALIVTAYQLQPDIIYMLGCDHIQEGTDWIRGGNERFLHYYDAENYIADLVGVEYGVKVEYR